MNCALIILPVLEYSQFLLRLHEVKWDSVFCSRSASVSAGLRMEGQTPKMDVLLLLLCFLYVLPVWSIFDGICPRKGETSVNNFNVFLNFYCKLFCHEFVSLLRFQKIFLATAGFNFTFSFTFLLVD